MGRGRGGVGAVEPAQLGARPLADHAPPVLVPQPRLPRVDAALRLAVGQHLAPLVHPRMHLVPAHEPPQIEERRLRLLVPLCRRVRLRRRGAGSKSPISWYPGHVVAKRWRRVVVVVDVVVVVVHYDNF